MPRLSSDCLACQKNPENRVCFGHLMFDLGNDEALSGIITKFELYDVAKFQKKSRLSHIPKDIRCEWAFFGCCHVFLSERPNCATCGEESVMIFFSVHFIPAFPRYMFCMFYVWLFWFDTFLIFVCAAHNTQTGWRECSGNVENCLWPVIIKREQNS